VPNDAIEKNADTLLTFSTTYRAMNAVDKTHTTAWTGR